MTSQRPPRISLEEVLLRNKVVNEVKLREYFSRSMREKKTIEQVLLEQGISEEAITSAKAESLGYAFNDLTQHQDIPEDLIKHIKPAYARKCKVLPLGLENNVLTLAMVEPRDLMAIEEIVRHFRDSKFIIKNVKIVMTGMKNLNAALEKLYEIPKDEGEMGSILSQVAETYKLQIQTVEVSREEATENSAPIVILANKIVEEAFQKRTSDIHIEPAADHLRVRYRIDGELREVMRVPKYAQDAVVARYKIMSEMRIDERRIPQDGRIDFMKYNPSVHIDLRVSTVPTPLGEDIVMRILDKKSSVLSISMLGFRDENMKLYKEIIKAPYGIILHVGPTGSGKTTALYAALKTLDVPDVKIVTAEDPVEYSLGGQIIQSNINAGAGYTFAKAIRAFMRHDPDIILIGEIRDLETAKTAVEASLTGHLVLSTLHTNDAVGTVTRLTEMGIEPYLVGDSLLLVCAQRLVRRICSKCVESYTATDEEIEAAKGDIKTGAVLYRGKGCTICEGSGYKGRTGIYEMLSLTRRLRNMLIKGSSTEDLRTIAMEEGMSTLRHDAIAKALMGTTTLEEVIATTLADV